VIVKDLSTSLRGDRVEMWCDLEWLLYCKFTRKCASERIL